MSAISGIEKVLGRIKSIEERMNTLSLSFEGRCAAPSAFRQNLLEAKLNNCLEKRLSSDDCEVESSINGEPEIPVPADFTSTNGLASFLRFQAKKSYQQNDALSITAKEDPKKIITFDEFPMQARTAVKFRELKQTLNAVLPGREILITSTTGGKHASPSHPEGRAVDFVIDGLTPEESRKVERIASGQGFTVYNEYITDSTYKTGDHMHVEF